MTTKTASVVQPGKGSKGKRKADQLSQATIARRQKKAQVAEEQLQLLEKHKEDLATVQDGEAEVDVMHELKTLRGMVGTCLAQLGQLDKTVIGLNMKVHKIHLNQDPGLSEAETEEDGEEILRVLEPEGNRIDRLFCENLSTTGSILEVCAQN